MATRGLIDGRMPVRAWTQGDNPGLSRWATRGLTDGRRGDTGQRKSDSW